MTWTDPTFDVEPVELAPQHTAAVRGQVAEHDVPVFIGAALGEVMHALGSQAIAPEGMPYARYEIVEGGFRVETGCPCSSPVAAQGRVVPSSLPGGPALVVHYVGPYDGLRAAYEAGERAVHQSGRRLSGPPWECYLDGPEVSKPRTDVVWPLAAE